MDFMGVSMLYLHHADLIDSQLGTWHNWRLTVSVAQLMKSRINEVMFRSTINNWKSSMHFKIFYSRGQGGLVVSTFCLAPPWMGFWFLPPPFVSGVCMFSLCFESFLWKLQFPPVQRKASIGIFKLSVACVRGCPAMGVQHALMYAPGSPWPISSTKTYRWMIWRVSASWDNWKLSLCVTFSQPSTKQVILCFN